MEAFDLKNEYAHLSLFDSKNFPLVYGPLQSRRFGSTIGINPLGTQKICSFDCAYCSLGRSEVRLNRIKKDISLPSAESIYSAFQELVVRPNFNSTEIQSITVSGNGEPTLHPEFSVLMSNLARIKKHSLPSAKLIVLSNGAHFDSRKVIEGLSYADMKVLKVDCGSDELMKSFNGPLVRMSIDRLLSNAKKFKDLTLQSQFVQGAIDNTKTSDVDEWIEVVGLIKPKQVLISGLSHVPAVSGLKRADEDTLHVIAAKLERRTGIKSLIFP